MRAAGWTPCLIGYAASIGRLAVLLRCACAPGSQRTAAHMATLLLACCRWLVLDGPLQGVWPRLLSDILHSSAKPKVNMVLCTQVAAACQGDAAEASCTRHELLPCTEPEGRQAGPKVEVVQLEAQQHGTACGKCRLLRATQGRCEPQDATEASPNARLQPRLAGACCSRQYWPVSSTGMPYKHPGRPHTGPALLTLVPCHRRS